MARVSRSGVIPINFAAEGMLRNNERDSGLILPWFGSVYRFGCASPRRSRDFSCQPSEFRGLITPKRHTAMRV